MPIHLRCRHCDKPLTAEDAQAGAPLSCPACQGTVTVPSAPPPADGAAWWLTAPQPTPGATPDWWVTPTRPAPFVAPPLERKTEPDPAAIPAATPTASLPLDGPTLPKPAPPAKTQPHGGRRPVRLMVAGGAMAALLLLAGALAILALPGKPKTANEPTTVASQTPANPTPLESSAPPVEPPKPPPPAPAKPPKKVEPSRPTAAPEPMKPAAPPKAVAPPKPAAPPRPVEPPKVVALPKPAPAALVKLPAASAKFVVKRRREQTEDQLRRQIEKVREVGLDTTDLRLASNEVVTLSKEAAAAHTPLEMVARLVAQRPDLAGLPFRMGKKCRLGPAQAEHLEGGSVALRTHLSEAAGIKNRADARAAAGTDRRPDPKVLYDRLMSAGDRHNKWLKPEAIPALQQLLMAENESIRAVLVDQLAHIDGKAASIALAQRALFDLNFEVRKRALEALSRRPPEEYRDELLKGFDYPWGAVADHAAEALAALKMHDMVPALIRLLERPRPPAPHVKPKKDTLVRELVRVNHLRNCLMCHALSLKTTDKVRGRVPRSDEPQTPTFTRDYYLPIEDILVRADVTYLRQDFSVPLKVKNHGKWPAAQRFDFMVRERPATPAEQLAMAKPGVVTERQKAIFFALRELTGIDAGPSPEDWKRLVLHHGKLTQLHKGLKGAGGVAVDGKGRIFLADAAASTLLRSQEDGTFGALRKESGGARGLVFDGKGRLLAAQPNTGRVVAINPETGAEEVLADRARAKHGLNPVQVAVDRHGGFYFTSAPRTTPVSDRGWVYYVSARGVVSRLAAVSMPQPRGVALSPDGKTLYVTGAGNLALTAYPLEGAGLLGKARVLCQLAVPRRFAPVGGVGVAVDGAGNVYVALRGANAVQVVNSEGARLALLRLPDAPVACTVAGKVLYVATRSALYSMTIESGVGVAAK